MSDPSKRVTFLNDLADVVDGNEEVIGRHEELLRQNAAVRELRDEAGKLAERIGRAGWDFRPDPELASRALAVIDARPSRAPTGKLPDEAIPQGGEERVHVSEHDEDEYEDEYEDGDEYEDDDEYEDEDEYEDDDAQDEPPPSAPPKRKASKSAKQGAKGAKTKAAAAGRSNMPLLIGLLVVLLAAGGGAAFMLDLLPFELGQQASAPSPPVRVQVPAAAAEGSGGATVTQVDTTAADGSGLTRSSGGKETPVSAKDSLPAGSQLRTDVKTRAGVELHDGASVLLDHDTEIVLKGDAGVIELHRGEILVSSSEQERATKLAVHTAAGQIELVGTQVLVSSDDTRSTVRVIRGEVRVKPLKGDPVSVLAGHEALLTRQGAPSVGPMMHMSTAMRWTELAAPTQNDWLPGLGQLTARAPGDKQDEESALKLAEHKVEVRIAGAMARTEVEELFVNEQARELEGIYRFPLPSDARIERLALQVDGQWHEGAFVAREQAAKIFRGAVRKGTPKKQRVRNEEYVWVPGPWRDPALLEWKRGGRFELRIFPIPAGAERRIRISYSQVLPRFGEGRRYVYPLPRAAGQTAVGRFEVNAEVLGAAEGGVRGGGYAFTTSPAKGGDGPATLTLQEDNFAARGDLVIDIRAAEAPGELSYFSYDGEATVGPGKANAPSAKDQARAHSDDRPYVAFALRPSLPPWQKAVPRHYLLLVDSSQSMYGERYARATEVVARTISEMDRRDTFQVLACDATCDARDEAAAAPSSQEAIAVRTWLEERRPAGASDLAQAMTAAARWLESARTTGKGSKDNKSGKGTQNGKPLAGRQVHVVYVGDGLASVGSRATGELAARAGELAADGSTRLSTVSLGSDADGSLLAQLARAGGGHHVPFVAGQRPLEVALSVLETGYAVTLDHPTLILPEGLADVAPATLPTLRAGEEVIVTARLNKPGVTGELVLQGQVGGEPFEDRYPVEIEPSRADANRFVATLWAAQRIGELELSDTPAARAQAIALSKAYGTISRHTSLLVLESQAMFEAFGEDPGVARPTWTGEEQPEEGLADGLAQINLLGGGAVAATGSGAGSAGGISARSAGKKARRRPGQKPSSAPALSAADGSDLPPPSKAGLGEAIDVDGELAVEAPEAAPVEVVAEPEVPAGRWMKKESYRLARVLRSAAALERDRRAVDEAAASLREKPDSRDRYRLLVRALGRQGNHERSIEVIEQWMERDALDPEALTYLSDTYGRRAERELALRLLSGVVDLQPDNVLLQERLARAFERASLPERACAHRVALSEIESESDTRAADALRCLRATQQQGAAARLLERMNDTRRSGVETLAGEPAKAEHVGGELMVTATWEGEADLDLSIVTNQGTRISWLGGRVDSFGADALSSGKEVLGLRRAVLGSYTIEIARSAADAGQEPVKGKLVIKALDEERDVEFELRKPSERLARVSITQETRLVAE